MPILRPYLTPTDMPVPVVAAARRKRNTMAQPSFYQQNLGSPQQQQQAQESQLVTPEPVRPQEIEFANTPNTTNYLQEQLQRFRDRTAPPSLEPSARIKSTASELVQPSSFKRFYDMLDSIGALGKQATAAVATRAAFSRLQASNSTGPNTSAGNNYGSGIPANPKANFAFAQAIAPQYGWNDRELSAWYTLGMKESGWNHNAQNPTSTAYGIGQFLNSTWKTVGGAKTSDPRTQVEYMARYIKQRYGSPSAALAFHLKNNWY